ncbi:MAG: FAD-binding protein [Sulfuricellaceae bacterium]|nr:FAD-binding protein [Sulfuricellaceae bacterium]
MLSDPFHQRLIDLLPKEDLLVDPSDCYAYGYDNSRKVFPPQAVVFARDTEQISRVVALCNEFSIPLIPRGRGTGTAGGSLPERGGVVLSLERMRRIVKFDPANRVLVVEPGVLNQEAQDAVRPSGFFWPPDPSSSAYCSIGGNLATGAAGPHAVKYGTTRDHVLGLTAVTGAGKIIHAGCYTTKGVVGYDLTRLLIGSEGTLAVIAEATLKLTPEPAARGGITAHFRDSEACAAAIAAIMAQPYVPSALEFMDRAALELVRRHYADLVPEATQALLMIEVDGSPGEVEAAGEAIARVCCNEGLLQIRIEADSRALWAARKALSPLLRDVAPKKINEDVVVPVSRLPELLRGLEALSGRYGLANVNFGHAGNGNIHVNWLVDPDDADQMRRAQACLDEMFDLVLGLNGTLSGEHGVGSEKRAYVPREIDAATLALMKDVKRVFDPNNILNPGKLFP